jgi:hypothetical protein
MANTKCITCPHCRSELQIGKDCKHTEDLSLICNICNKVVFPINAIQEQTITTHSKVQTSYSTNYANDFYN